MSSTVWCASISQVALGLDGEVERAVAGELVEHVVEERDAGGELRIAAAVEVERHADLRLPGVALDFRLAHGCQAMAAASACGHPVVLFGRADREPQAVVEQRMRAVEVANQYTTLPQALEGARRVGHAHQHEVGRAREARHARDAVEGRLQALRARPRSPRSVAAARRRGRAAARPPPSTARSRCRAGAASPAPPPSRAGRWRARGAAPRGRAWRRCAPAPGSGAARPRPAASRRPRTRSTPRPPPRAPARRPRCAGSPRAGKDCRWDCSDTRSR